MNPASKDICDILAAAGLGLVVETNLFLGQEPTEPSNCVTVYDTPGYEPGLTMDKTEKWQRPSVQVRVRNLVYMTGYDLIWDIMNVLHGLSHEIWNTTTYELIKCTQDPFPLDYDEQQRPRFVCNFDVQRKP